MSNCAWCGRRLLVWRLSQANEKVCPDPAACKKRATR